MNDKTVIGQVEKVELPELAVDLCARIDTGARTSAIWASQVSENAQGLHVVFFDQDSPQYNGKIVTFTDYTETIVSSSNGIAEHRYKVKLQVTIGGRRIRARFTLADRSQQVYPVLIGRNVLRGKFVVDVAQQSKNLHAAEKNRSRLLRRELGELS